MSIRRSKWNSWTGPRVAQRKQVSRFVIRRTEALLCLSSNFSWRTQTLGTGALGLLSNVLFQSGSEPRTVWEACPMSRPRTSLTDRTATHGLSASVSERSGKAMCCCLSSIRLRERQTEILVYASSRGQYVRITYAYCKSQDKASGFPECLFGKVFRLCMVNFVPFPRSARAWTESWVELTWTVRGMI